MKIGIYDPYLDTLGGGEKYVLEIAMCLAKNHEVFIFWDIRQENLIKKGAKERFDLNISQVQFTKNIFIPEYSKIKRAWVTKDYDVILYMSDGSIPTLFAKKNILLFQFPINWIKPLSYLTRIKLKNIHAIICYSQFVKKHLDKIFDRKAIVLPPAVDINKGIQMQKENILLTVGRFTKKMNTKKQDILIDIFKKMCEKGLSKWKLIIIGSVLPQDEDYVSVLKEKSTGYPIDILMNISFEELVGYYKKAKIYWHAAGYGEDLSKHPDRAEHFGISTVEAMSCGVVPVVINAGGQTEIVDDNKNGFLWDTKDDISKKTLQLVTSSILWKDMSQKAIEKSKQFNSLRFCDSLARIIE